MKATFKVTIDSDSLDLSDEQRAYLENNWQAVLSAVLEPVVKDVIPNEVRYQVKLGIELDNITRGA